MSSQKQKSYYMHTIDGKPATFDGNQICYATYFGKANDLCSSLAQIHREQQASIRFRRLHGLDDFPIGRYSHLRFKRQEG